MSPANILDFKPVGRGNRRARHVKGSLFVDYARMIRSRKAVDWRLHLTPDDMELVSRHVDLEKWYPMEVFERLGLAILAEVGDLAGVLDGDAWFLEPQG